MSKYTKLARGICDLLLWLALTAASLLLSKLVKPFKRGFFCGDESLSYPLRPNTIGEALLIGIALLVPTSVIIVVELFKQLPANARDKQRDGCRIVHRLGQLYKQAGYYLFGLAMLTFTTVLSKLCLGRLRPHFFAVCQPMLPDGSSCQDAQNIGRYIDSYSCSNANVTDHDYAQMNLSFPSGHASLIIYAMLYLAIYLQAALSTRISKLLKHLLQFLFVMFGWYVSLTRITDYWHHWSDVLAGVLLGVLFAWLTSIYVADLFAFKRWQRAGYSANTLKKAQVSPKSSTKSQSQSQSTAAAMVAPALPAYTFGTLPYLAAHPAAQAQYAQTYHNYGYVP
ncbi:CG11438 [Drosophila busckii]|uniref:CG11438 n=1 Tax=Drosophila busckii TaxID=30019 RepID=A0A0M4EZS1_DROBS|nr:putative phosphatidate phosphatase [Drosophila busckii]ALC44262.1 CG11438 [Drosophila busckii]